VSRTEQPGILRRFRPDVSSRLTTAVQLARSLPRGVPFGMAAAASARHVATPPSSRFLASGDEAGTAPGDRKFRPGVEGPCAVAVVLELVYHAGVSGVTGGYVCVDVLCLLSGFVITGLLLRERFDSSTGRLLSLHSRRCRRILPAATLANHRDRACTYHRPTFITGNATAQTGSTALLIDANFHFISTGPSYLASQAPPRRFRTIGRCPSKSSSCHIGIASS
jgi:hypothetical protein